MTATHLSNPLPLSAQFVHAAVGQRISQNLSGYQSAHYLSTSISGYLRITSATTGACSGFPLDRASASRACAASSIG